MKKNKRMIANKESEKTVEKNDVERQKVMQKKKKKKNEPSKYRREKK